MTDGAVFLKSADILICFMPVEISDTTLCSHVGCSTRGTLAHESVIRGRKSELTDWGRLASRQAT